MIRTLLICIVASALAMGSAAETKKLSIVLMLGEAEMVGQARISSARYLVQKPFIPPKDVTLNAHKGMLHQVNGAYLYWQAMDAYGGPPEKAQELKRLMAERDTFKATFKKHVLDQLEKNNGTFRGKTYASRRGFWLFNMCDEEAEKIGITPKIRAILDGPDNAFNVTAAYDRLIENTQTRYKRQQELKKWLLPETTLADFDAFDSACEAFDTQQKKAPLSATDKRKAYVELARRHIKLPVAKRTHIVALGNVAGDSVGDGVGQMAHGPLSVGYGYSEFNIGPEYTAGLAIERAVDGPVLIVKCAWRRKKSIGETWSADGENSVWQPTAKLIEAVLENPGKYHPGYSPEAGCEVAGLIWFQGLLDRNDADYGNHLESVIRRTRKLVKKPKLPVVCGTVGATVFRKESDAAPVNRAIRALASKPELKGTMAVVDTHPFYPAEIQMINSLFFKRKLNDNALNTAVNRVCISRGRRNPPYIGSASFFLLVGDAFGQRLATMLEKK